jgi:proline iminopeptidase
MTTLTTGKTYVSTHAGPFSLLWQDQRIAVAVAVGIAALSGLLIALAMPRGPITPGQALTLMAVGFVTGAVAGFLMRSSWAMLLAPLAFVIVFELGRLGAVGPTVDAPYFGTLFGVLAFILGRGVFALLGLLPMALGVAYGAELARWVAGELSLSLDARRILMVLVTLLLLGLAVLIARPASTPPILGADGTPLAGSIAVLEKVRLGGRDQSIMIRGQSTDNPVLLYLSGGPGQSDLPYTRTLFEDLTRNFIVVGWDQRGTGKSYTALEPTSTLTLERAISDTIELTNYLRDRFDEEKIYLLGESWGSTLGVLAVERQPELYHAFIGSGQMVSQSVTDRIIWRDLLAYAQSTGDWELYDRVLTFGEPPYRSMPWANAFVMGYYDALYKPYTPPASYIERGTAANLSFYGILGSEYTFIEKINVLRGLIDVFTVMYPQLQEIDFRKDVTRLEVPVYMLDGQAELSARRDLALEWFEMLEAPIKRMYAFENAAHSVAFEQFEALHRIMTDTIVPETYSR